MAEERKGMGLPLGEGAGRPWYAEGLRFSCTGCGHCCSGGPGYVWVTAADREAIAAELGVSVEEFNRRYVRQVGQDYSLVEKQHYDCVFLERDKEGKTRCAIYAVRPMQCRTWPFWNQNLKSRQAWAGAAERCPGMRDGEGRKYSLAEMEERRTHPESL